MDDAVAIKLIRFTLSFYIEEPDLELVSKILDRFKMVEYER